MVDVDRSWPVRLISAGAVPFSLGAIAWRAQGAQQGRLTVIVKATFALVSENAMTPHAPEPLVVADMHYGDDPRNSLEHMSDLSPYRAQAEVFLNGHVYAPPGRRMQVGGARLLVYRGEQILVRKTITVYGDRTVDTYGRMSDPTPFQQMRLVYERAVFHGEWNPIGRTASSGHAPNFILGEEPTRPACFGPISPHWPARVRFLHGLDPRSLLSTTLELPQHFDWGFFLAAPKDQRMDFLKGDEVILLGGVHPMLPMLRTRLPGVRAQARIFRDSGSAEPLDLWGDTLSIDVDKQIATVLFRSNVVFTSADASSTVVVAGLELPNVPLVFPATVPLTGAISTPTAISSFSAPRTTIASNPDNPTISDDKEHLSATLPGLFKAPTTSALPFAAGNPAANPPPGLLPQSAYAKPPLVPPPQHRTLPASPAAVDEDLSGTLPGLLKAPATSALPFATGKPAARPPTTPPPQHRTLPASPAAVDEDLSGTLPGLLKAPATSALPFATGNPAARPPPAAPQMLPTMPLVPPIGSNVAAGSHTSEPSKEPTPAQTAGSHTSEPSKELRPARRHLGRSSQDGPPTPSQSLAPHNSRS